MLNWMRRILGGGDRTSRSIRLVVPRLQATVSRLQPVRARYDDAVTSDDNRRHWANADGLSANAANSSTVRRTLRNRARYETANNSYARGIVLTLANDVVGTGPRLQLTTSDAAANSRIERAFMTWARWPDARAGDQRAGGMRPKFLPARAANGHPGRAGEGSRGGGGAGGTGGGQGSVAGACASDGGENGRGLPRHRPADGESDRDLWRLGYRLAGIAGVDPGPYSLRQLIWMADGAAQERWNHTAQLLATLCELQRNPKRRSQPFTADEFHPYLRTRRRGTPLTRELLRSQARRWFASQTGQTGSDYVLHR